MAQTDAEVVLVAVEAMKRQDADAFVATLSPEIAWEDDVFPGLAGCYRGIPALREWFGQAVVEPWESIDGEVEEVVDAGEGCLFVGMVVTARGKGSGVETELRFWQVVWLVGGLIAKRRAFLERAPALEAAGLAPRT